MTFTPKILAFAGSTRIDSYNKKLVKIAAAGAKAAGAEVTDLDLRDLPLPLYDEDLEAQEGMPANARTLKDLMISHQGFLIASPEYNSSLTAVLKNAIDWASRPYPNESPLAAFSGKVATIMSASPGGLGGLRGLVHLRSILGNIKVLVLPDQIAVSKAYEAFNADGTLKDPKQQESIEKLGEGLTKILFKLN
ncbi:NADPH-dependent FMN reductase [Nostoc linckia z18]|jgi:chromate reductase, NAD(P)H dehydrogenase (quinone)|uniref:NADPH-dependent FMN reductase n=2 Tax=Nostoc linckia TaxID=92942 RepID=A0A9Q5Z949_NOSLI|nr:NAD(P)H-dependent oxidoreductase [Nostoc linckia]PHK32003.1 NADPH-dependent FMN reductase [Nostoc linckia z15]PHK40049.1 NADPH-dependent FMN reductase [Nostoc linckia z16]PHJ54982.1 NADPH-dependent FMN reductase [Nostoc linckia z1]PHJ57276.1 NADPH-dependent FMN reductase [Nostoc linckia z2]PHJ71565.1 NADPH-dependent FMN reductase [Nostoc linckia z3]